MKLNALLCRAKGNEVVDNKYFYSIDDSGDCYEIKTIFDIKEDSEWVAQEAAEDYHSNHDGWEDTWPLNISLHLSEEYDPVCTLKVELEFEPSFSASVLTA